MTNTSKHGRCEKNNVILADSCVEKVSDSETSDVWVSSNASLTQLLYDHNDKFIEKKFNYILTVIFELVFMEINWNQQLLGRKEINLKSDRWFGNWSAVMWNAVQSFKNLKQ